MTEKEMEDLLWNHPDKFLSEPLKQFRRQPQSRVGRADLVFEDRLGRLLVVELKKGKLGRGAVAQLVDYFGMVKREFPDKPVELMVVANVIPEERRLACEQYNIDCREISAKRFRDIASEVGYEFESEKNLIEAVSAPSEKRLPRTAIRSWGAFDPAVHGYQLKSDLDREELGKLVDQFAFVAKRKIDKSLAVHLTEELLEREPPRVERSTFLQLARWCKTENPLYWDGMDVARKISIHLFGKVLDRSELGT